MNAVNRDYQAALAERVRQSRELAHGITLPTERQTDQRVADELRDERYRSTVKERA